MSREDPASEYDVVRGFWAYRNQQGPRESSDPETREQLYMVSGSMFGDIVIDSGRSTLVSQWSREHRRALLGLHGECEKCPIWGEA